jgi:hypothetical protein
MPSRLELVAHRGHAAPAEVLEADVVRDPDALAALALGEADQRPMDRLGPHRLGAQAGTEVVARPGARSIAAVTSVTPMPGRRAGDRIAHRAIGRARREQQAGEAEDLVIHPRWSRWSNRSLDPRGVQHVCIPWGAFRAAPPPTRQLNQSMMIESRARAEIPRMVDHRDRERSGMSHALTLRRP